jgi:hypothetical protein
MGSSPHSHRNHDTNEINDVMNKLDFSVLMTRGNDARPVMSRWPGNLGASWAAFTTYRPEQDKKHRGLLSPDWAC